jgi:hyperosmotically inducible protein
MHPNWSRSFLARALIVLITLPFAVAACATTVDQTSDDAMTTAAVKTALLNDAQAGTMKIDVDTANGVVTLSGVVASQPDAERAIALARQAPGVKDVKSVLQVTPPTPQP